MILTAQFGEGNFLRSFADLYFDTLNKEGGDYAVTVIQPINFGSLDNFQSQDNRYHVILRGMNGGRAVEDVYAVSAVKKVFSPFADIESYYALACDPELKLIVSNTTEAGICFNETDSIDGFDGITYPAKLTKFLYERYRKGLPGVYLMPVELIESNADELYSCVDRYIKLWDLPEGFKTWNDTENYYCNTLVDRIVSGYPRDEETRAQLTALIGEEDALMSVAEPFGLWAVQKKGNIADFIKEGVHNIEVVLTEDIGYYKKRKVRVLNGSHTNMVPAGLVLGHKTVYDCMTNERVHAFFKNSLEEIIPFVSSDIAMTRKFADDVEQRFFNPFLNHQLMSIALNSISKWKARVLPSFKDYYEKNGKIPHDLTVGFSYLMYLYQTRHAELQDDAEILADFAAKRPIADIMWDSRYWGEDLTAYKGFYEAVSENLERIAKGEILI